MVSGICYQENPAEIRLFSRVSPDGCHIKSFYSDVNRFAFIFRLFSFHRKSFSRSFELSLRRVVLYQFPAESEL